MNKKLLSALLSLISFISIIAAMWVTVLDHDSGIRDIWFQCFVFLLIGTFAGLNAMEKRGKRDETN